MTEQLNPITARDTCEIIADAITSEKTLEIMGAGSRRSIGRPMETDHILSTSALNGVSLYEPDELVLRAGPGTTMTHLQSELAQNGQMLAFEPPDYGPLLGVPLNLGTLGGMVAGNLAGPRRIKVGAARDHFLGVEAVSGRGEIFRSGGRVVKNVTGYDLCKLMAGSWGTLGVMTDITVKVMPAPEKTRTLLVNCPNLSVALSVMTAALSSPHDVSAAAWLPQSIVSKSAVSYVASSGAALAALRLEGISRSVEERCRSLREDLASFGDLEELHSHNSLNFWREVRDVRAFIDFGDRDALWKISVAPAEAQALLNKLHAVADMDAFLDWGGGLIWAQVSGMDDGGSSIIRRTMGAKGGHATLIRGSIKQRALEPVFHPELPAVARLTERIKDAFDPKRILNPGRMFEGV